MKKIISYVFLFLFTTYVAYSQYATLSGKIFDSVTKKALPYANISLNDNSKTIAGVISDNKGMFVLKGIPEGKFIVEVSFLGYETKQVSILVGKLNNNYDLGRIELKELTTALDEVTVQAKKAIVSSGLEKKTFDISENISNTGGSVLESLRNLPGVTITPEGQVLLRGSDKVTILIDGKQSSLTGFGNQKGLDNIPASNIAQIEIINNPSAKYDAKGLAGLINIIYKKEKESGLNGDVSVNVGVGELTQRKVNLPNIMDKYALTPKLNPALSLNYRAKNINLFLQSDGMVRKRVNTNDFTTRNYSNGNADLVSQFLENRSQQLYNIKAGFDWFINSNNTLTLYSLFEDEYHIDRGHVPYDYTTGVRKRFWTWVEDENTRFINYAANYKHQFTQPGHTLEAGYLYTEGGEDELFSFTDSSAVRNSDDQTHLIVREIVSSFNLDYVKPIRSGRLEFGSKVQLRKIPISYTIAPGENSVLNTQLGTWSEYDENVYAVYGNIVHESEKFDIEGGLRLEQSTVNYDIDPVNIYYTRNDAYKELNLFPNIRFTLKFNPSNKLSVFYNKRVDRPGEFELRPFPKYDDPEILKTGNPYLRPQYTNTIEMAYKRNWKRGSAYASVFYRKISNVFSRIYTIDTTSTNIINTIPQNIGEASNAGFELSFEQKITKKWNMNASFNWYANTINAFTGTSIYPYQQTFTFAESKSSTWSAKWNNNIKLPYETNLQFSAVYYAPDIIPQGKIKERFSFDLGLKKQTFKGKAEISLAATDLFNTFGIRKTIVGDDFTMDVYNYYETQVVTLGLKYKF